MLNQDQLQSIEPQVRTIKIISIALNLGVLFFAGIVVFLSLRNQWHQNLNFLVLIAAGAALMSIISAFTIPRIINSSLVDVQAHQLKNAGKKEAESSTLKKLLEAFQTSHIIKCVLLEAAAFINFVMFMVDKGVISLLVGGICFGLLIVSFPTTGRIVSWIEDKVREIDRQL